MTPRTGRLTWPAWPIPDGEALGGERAVPGGLAVKLYPCCYALQRPISALAELARARGLESSEVSRIVLRTPEAAVTPLIHHRPVTGLQAKFSLEYAAAAALLDGYPGFASFTDEAVLRPDAIRLAGLVETKLEPGGSWLLDGELEAAVHTRTGEIERISQRFPPGSPAGRRRRISCAPSSAAAWPPCPPTRPPGPGTPPRASCVITWTYHAFRCGKAGKPGAI